jgi:hypothetical protein
MLAQGVFKPLVDNELPEYSQELWWLTNERGEAVQFDEAGRFEISPSLKLDLRWAHPAGAVLNRWTMHPVPPYELNWDGVIRLGGFVERTHIVEFDGLGLLIAELVGGAYPQTYQGLPSLADLQAKPFARDESESDPSGDGHWYSLLVPLESPFADFLHHCLVNGNALDCQCRLGDDEGGWQDVVGLPLIVEGLSLLSTQLHRLG